MIYESSELEDLLEVFKLHENNVSINMLSNTLSIFDLYINS